MTKGRNTNEPNGGQRTSASAGSPMSGRSRSGAVVQKPHLTRFDTNNETTPIQNMGRSKALTPSAKTNLLNKTDGLTPIQNMGRSGATTIKAPVTQDSPPLKNEPRSSSGVSKISDSTLQQRANIGNLILKHQQEMGQNSLLKTSSETSMFQGSQERLDKKDAFTYRQAQRGSLSQKVHSFFNMKMDGEDKREANSNALSLKDSVERMKNYNAEATRTENASNTASTVANVASGIGLAATVAGAATGGSTAAVGVGAGLLASGANASASRKANQASEEYAKNVDNSRTGANLFDSNISGEKSKEMSARGSELRNKAIAGAITTGVNLGMGSAGVEKAVETGSEIASKALSSKTGVTLGGKLGEAITQKFQSIKQRKNASQAEIARNMMFQKKNLDKRR